MSNLIVAHLLKLFMLEHVMFDTMKTFTHTYKFLASSTKECDEVQSYLAELKEARKNKGRAP